MRAPAEMTTRSGRRWRSCGLPPRKTCPPSEPRWRRSSRDAAHPRTPVRRDLKLDTSLCRRCWMPPLAGGNSGVRTSTLVSDTLTSAHAVEPEAEGEQRPECVAPVGAAGQVVVHHLPRRAALEPAPLERGARSG